MNLSDFNYTYPEELVAQRPLPERDASRMLLVDREKKTGTDSRIKDLPKYINKDDLLIINESKVFPARLIGKKETGGEVELLLLKELQENVWSAMATHKKRIKVGSKIDLGLGLQARVMENSTEGIVVELKAEGDPRAYVDRAGLPPLPPYIRRGAREDYTDEDRERYQTVYAKNTGSAAAPTAGFHLTKEILSECREKGASVKPLTLHVGLDTFQPVREELIEDHKIHGEEYFIPEETAAAIERTKTSGGRVIAVGTTSVRALESFTQAPRLPGSQAPRPTNLFIYPGYKFRTVDVILTNFHQPKSTLLMLVSAFAGREFILQMYAHAIKERYRLFSYGDCMLVF